MKGTVPAALLMLAAWGVLVLLGWAGYSAISWLWRLTIWG